MATAATIAAKLMLDTSGYDKGIKSAKNAASSFGTKMGKIGGTLSKMGTVMTASVTAPIIAGFTKMTLSAAEASETIGAVDMVFGDAAESIHNFAETSADAVGLSSTEFKQLGTVTGSFLQNLGYTSEEASEKTIMLSERASDMAAVFNTDVSQALQAIQSGLKGEMNPLENFGVKMNAAAIEAKALSMGLADQNGELDDNAKAQATLALIMEQTSRVQGTFKKESEGLSGQMKILKANIEDAGVGLGNVLLPAATDMIKKVTELAQKFANLSTEQQEQIVKWGLVAAAIGPALIVIGKVIVILPKLITGLKAAKAAAIGLDTITSGMLGPLALLAAAIAAVVAAIIIFKKKTNEQIEVMEDAKKAALENGDGYEEYQKALEDAGHETDQTKQKTSEYRATLKTARADLERLRDEHIISKDKFAELYSKMDVGIITAEEMSQITYELEQGMSDTGDAVKYAGTDMGYYSDQAEIAAGHTKTMTGEVKDAAEAAADYYDYVDLATSGTEDWGGMMNEVSGIASTAFGSIVSRAEELTAAQKDIEEHQNTIKDLMAIKGTGGYFEGVYMSASDVEIKLRDVHGEIEGLQDKMTDAANQMVLDMLMVEITADGMVTGDEMDAYFDMAVEFGTVSREAADQAVEEYNRAKATISGNPIDVNFSINNGDVDRYLAGLTRQVTVPVNFSITGVPAVPEASGGPVLANYPYLIGEKGPELFVPNVSGTIIPNSELETIKNRPGTSYLHDITNTIVDETMTMAQKMRNSLMVGLTPELIGGEIKQLLKTGKNILNQFADEKDFLISIYKGGLPENKKPNYQIKTMTYKEAQANIVNNYNLTMPTSNNPMDVMTAFELLQAYGD